MGRVEEILIAAPNPVPPLVRAKSTLVVGSIATLKARGHYAAYEALLPAARREAILFAVAGAWLPIETVDAHYAACDALGLSTEEQIATGRAMGQRVTGAVLGTAVRLARTAGATPWNVLSQLQRFWERGFDGGGIEVVRLAPKDARVRLLNVQLARLPYIRNGFVGIVMAFLEPFARKVFVRLGPSDATSITFDVQWA